MKKSKVLFPVCLILFLTGCASKPQSAKDGQKWSDDWTVMGSLRFLGYPEGCVS